MYKSVDIVGPFGTHKDYSLPQLDELTTDQAETYKQQFARLEQNDPDEAKGWWDEKDPSTWIPYGWKPTDEDKWCEYAIQATEVGNGLIPYYELPFTQVDWDPNDPLTWVPFGWRIKDETAWKDWHESQKEEDSDVSPHEGLLAPEGDWSSVEPSKVMDAEKASGSDPHRDTKCTFEEAYGIGAPKPKREPRGKFGQQVQKTNTKPVSPFGDGNYEEYHAQQKKLGRP